jgi:shikimate kinase
LHIPLIGLPGSGKTTVGRQLARRLQLPFIDSDQELEAQLGCSIKDYFAHEGEERFRDAEQQIIDTLTQGKPCVLSTGGGVVLRPANRQHLRERGQVVYLSAHPEELFRRLKRDTTRPLLQVSDPLVKMRELHAQRDPLYRDTAHYVIETGRPSVAMLVSMIVMQLELSGAV